MVEEYLWLVGLYSKQPTKFHESIDDGSQNSRQPTMREASNRSGNLLPIDEDVIKFDL